MITIKEFVDLIFMAGQTSSTKIVILDYKGRVIIDMKVKILLNKLVSSNYEVISNSFVEKFEVSSPENHRSIKITLYTNLVRKYKYVAKFYKSEEEANQDTEFDRERS